MNIFRILPLRFFLFLCCSMLLAQGTAYAKEDGPAEDVVRVGYFLFDGYHMIDENGRKYGYGYDYLQKIRAYTGFKYAYVGDNENVYWKDMLPMLDAGKIDLLTSVSKTEGREEKYEFSSRPIGTKMTILTVKAGNGLYRPGNQQAWSGIRIGILKRNSQNQKLAEYAAERGFTYVPVECASSQEQAEYLQNGRVDAILSSNLRSINNEWLIASFAPTPFYAVTRKGNTKLMDEVNAAIEHLKEVSPMLEEELFRKYYTPDSGDKIFFSAAERRYLEKLNTQGMVLRAAVSPDNPPYSYFENGVARGMLVDIAKAILKRAGITMQIVPAKDKKTYKQMVLSGNVDLVLDGGFDYFSAEKYGYLLTEPYYSLSLSALTLTKKPARTTGVAAMVEGGSYIRNVLLQEELKGVKVEYYPCVADCVEAVADGKADYAVLYTNNAQRIASSDPTKRFSSQKYPLVSSEAAIAVNEMRGSLLVSIIDKATKSFERRHFAAIAQPYLQAGDEKFSWIRAFYDNPAWFMLTLLCLLAIVALAVTITFVEKNKARIKRINEDLSEALRAARKADESKSQFLAQVSHEIRTPMNAIIGLTTIAKTEIRDPKKIMEYLGKIESSSKLLLGIINDVLDMSAIEGGKLKIDKAPFDFKKQITNITAIFYQQAKLKNIKFDVRMHGVTEETLEGDELRLNQVLMNLLSNAVKFTPASGKIQLSITQASRMQGTVQMRFAVTDTGCGMGPDMLERLFRPFEQESASTARKHGGSGLGLSITKRLVELMGGSIRVESAAGSGTTFTVDITFGLCAESRPANFDAFQHIRVLVVDDDKESCDYSSILMKRLGLRHDCVMDGESALEMLGDAEDKEDPYQLCIIDWQMPKMNGVEVTQKIREIFGDETIVIIVSAFDLNEVEAAGKAAGANYFIPKPLFQSTVFDALMKISRGAWEMNGTSTKAAEQFDFSGKKVLVAEDVALNMEVAIKLLKMVGIDVTCAEDGQQALSLYEKSPDGQYDCILLDINMPVMDGYEAARAIRISAKPDAKTIPIYAMTANAFTQDVSAALDAGMNGHIAKPIETDVLYSTLKKAFQGEQHEQI